MHDGGTDLLGWHIADVIIRGQMFDFVETATNGKIVPAEGIHYRRVYAILGVADCANVIITLLGIVEKVVEGCEADVTSLHG